MQKRANLNKDKLERVNEFFVSLFADFVVDLFLNE
jgi:hypothetical protein